MRLAVLTSTISREAGGLFQSVRHLHKTVAEEIETNVISFHDQFTDTDLDAWKGIPVEICPYIGPSFLKFSPAMSSALNKAAPELVHVHGLWQGTSIASLQYHKAKGFHHMVSPRGMLDSWALDNSRWKKKLAERLFERSHLESAACLHALCQSEVEAIRNFGLTNPVALVPNGVSLPEERRPSHDHQPRKRILLFVGRIHPKKGLPLALKAWATIRDRSDWQFVIAGWDQNDHASELKALCSETSLMTTEADLDKYLEDTTKFAHQDVVFVGPAYGTQKSSLLNHASAFILPSFSEGMPMSILEAWAHELPVLMTRHCNLDDGFEQQAAIPLETSVSSIKDRLEDLLRTDHYELQQMGQNGHRLIEGSYTWPKVARQMKEVYHWLLGEGQTPDFVTFK